MANFLKTARLLIRPALLTDLDGFFELDTDPEVVRYVGMQPLQHREQAAQTIAHLQQQYINNGTGRWVVTEQATGAFLGWAGIKLIRETINGHKDFYELGYRLLRKHWGKGFATEAAKATLDHGFSLFQPEAIYAMADARNTASDAVLRKCGLVRGPGFEHDKLLHNWYRITRSDWQQ